jgi:DNA-binding transcriptional LysR family regulator
VIDVRKLQQFFVLARMGNFTKASAELHLSQSALTRSVQSLERQLGVRLLDRERGRAGVTLTPAGSDLCMRADAVFEQLAKMEASIAKAPRHTTRRLRFGMGPMTANALLNDVLRRKVESEPDLAVSVVSDTSDAMALQLLDGEIEFYIGRAPQRRHSSRIRHQFFAPLVPAFYVRKGHPLLDLEVVTREALLRYPRISGTAWNEKLHSVGEPPEHQAFSASIEVDNYSILGRIAEQTDAILLSASIGAYKKLVRLPVDEDTTRTIDEVRIFSLVGAKFSPAAEEMIRDLRSALKDQNLP